MELAAKSTSSGNKNCKSKISKGSGWVRPAIKTLVKMLVLYWNVRGLAREKARDSQKNLILVNNSDVVVLAEPLVFVKSININKLGIKNMSGEVIHNKIGNKKANIWIL